MSWGRSASSSSSQAASSPLSDSPGRSSSSSSSTAPRPPSTRKRSALPRTPVPGGRTRGPPPHLPLPPCRAPPPRLRFPGAGGGEGLSPAPRRRGLGAERPGYPPAAPDANEHMAVVPREPGAPGGGDQARQRTRNRLRALPAREPGNERECEREREREHAAGPKLREPCGAWKQESARAGSPALPASGPLRCSRELGWAGRESGLRLLPQG